MEDAPVKYEQPWLPGFGPDTGKPKGEKPSEEKMSGAKDFKFVVRVNRVCKKCGKVKLMFRTQKACDECRGVKRSEDWYRK